MNRLITFACLLLASGVCMAQSLVRVPNATLQMPATPPVFGYTLSNAFPGLSFSSPVCIASPPGETNRLFVLEKDGRIQVITNLANPNKTLFLDISGPVNPNSEGGLLGLAFHPGYKTNHYFFVYYTLTTTTSAGSGFHDRLSRFEISSANTNVAVTASELPLITQYDEAANHNGGDVHFGPDGYLYLSLGDEGNGGDYFQNSQRIDKDFFSAMLRIDVDHRPGNLSPNPHSANTNNPGGVINYSIPADNPFVGATSFNGSSVDPAKVRTEFWAVGLRNPWRFSFDPVTKQLYCGDVGQNLKEEIDIIIKGGNYGWNYFEATNVYSGTPPAGVVFQNPIWQYSRGSGTNQGNSVTGGVVYRGQKHSDLYGAYVFADYVSGNVWSFLYDGTNVSGFRRLTGSTQPVAFGIDPSNRDVLIAELSGGLRRLVKNDVSSGVPLPPTLADTGAFSELATLTPNPGIVPYDINVPFWSDHAKKARWFSVPNTNLTIGFNPTSNWSFPTGSVWIKHFELELTNGVPESARRLETRFIVRNDNGVYGVTYRWNTLTNATLVPDEGLDEAFAIHDNGTIRTQVWHYPSRTECLRCHTAQGGLAVGFTTAQLNRAHDYNGTNENQLAALSAAGYFNEPVTNVQSLPQLAHATNTAFSLEHRTRSYLEANCVYCHQPGGSGLGSWDARTSTPLYQAGIINGALVNDLGDPLNRVLDPGSLEHSMLLTRIANLGPRHMPPLATSELNQEAIDLLQDWIIKLVSPMLHVTNLNNGSFSLWFEADTNTPFSVEYTESFSPTNWTFLGNPVPDTNGIFRINDSLQPGGDRFYRTVSP